MYLIGGHYRQPLAFSEPSSTDADRRVYRIRDALAAPGARGRAHARRWLPQGAFLEALAEDFNTPKALASLFEWVREANAALSGGRS